MFSVIETSVNLDAVKLEALYLVKLIFGEYFRYFDANCVADLLQLHLQLDAIRVLVREGVNPSMVGGTMYVLQKQFWITALLG